MKLIYERKWFHWVLYSLFLAAGCKLSTVPDVQKLQLKGNVGDPVSTEFEITNDYSFPVDLIIDEKPNWIKVPDLEGTATLAAGTTKKFEIEALCRDDEITQEARVFVMSVPGSPVALSKEFIVQLTCGRDDSNDRPPKSPSQPSPQNMGVIYVAPNGSDSGVGSENNPFRTLTRALEMAGPGTEIIVADGVYKAESATYGLWVDKAGITSQPIRFIAKNKHRAIIDGAGQTHYGVTFGANAENIVFEGFDIRGFQDGAFFTQEAQNLVLSHNILHHIGRGCSDSQYGRSAIYLGKQARNITIDSNIIHTIGRYGPGEFGCQPETLYWQNHDHGVYLKASEVTIVNNVFYKMDRGWAVHGYGNDLADIKIINNSFIGPNPNRSGHILLAGDYKFTNWVIQNNIFENPNAKALSFNCEKVSGVRVIGNISTTPLASDGSCLEGHSNVESASSIVENFGNYVYVPREVSRACDVAIASGAPTHDIEGNPRPPERICAGAYQR